MGNPVKIVANVVTGGLYGAVESGISIATGKGDIFHELKNALNTLGPWGSVMMQISPEIAQIGNLAGAAGGLLAGGLAGVTPSGFGAAAEGAVVEGAPSALASGASVIPEAEGGAAALTGSGAPPVLTGTGEGVSSAAQASADSSLYADSVVSNAGLGNANTGLASVATGAPETASIVPSLSSNFGANAVSDVSLGMSGAGAADLSAAATSFGAVAPGAEAGWWAAQPAGVKAALLGGGIFAGGQLVSGAMGGLFAGMSAQKKLQLEQLINQQNQNQRQYLNTNNQYAPLLAFKPQPGLATTPKTGA
jgi:hypothetical protein